MPGPKARRIIAVDGKTHPLSPPRAYGQAWYDAW